MQIEFSLKTHNGFRSFFFLIFRSFLCWFFTKREELDTVLTRGDTKGLVTMVIAETLLLIKACLLTCPVKIAEPLEIQFLLQIASKNDNGFSRRGRQPQGMCQCMIW